MAESFVADLEGIVNEVAQWGANEVKAVYDALAPDGKPYGVVDIPLAKQLDDYRLMRNDVQAWATWISMKASDIANHLMQKGIHPETINAIDPLQIALIYATDYATRMEKELEKRMI